MAPPRSDPTHTPPWWLGGGERCEVCLQPYVLEVQVCCATCDCPHCPLCECARCRSEKDDEAEGES